MEFGKSLPLSDNIKAILSRMPIDVGKGELVDKQTLSIACTICMNTADEFLNLRRVHKRDAQYFKELGVGLCQELEITTEEVCEEYLDQNLVRLFSRSTFDW